MEDIANNYKHIKGWGVDADPKNEPTYPMKHWTGDDHKRLDYERAEQQPVDQEVLISTERPEITRVFGTSVPLKGLSGVLRRTAFEYSEGQLRHWITLMLADRVDVVEGMVEDLGQGRIPDFLKVQGWRADMKHRPDLLVRKVAVRAIIIGAAAALIYSQVRSARRRKAV